MFYLIRFFYDKYIVHAFKIKNHCNCFSIIKNRYLKTLYSLVIIPFVILPFEQTVYAVNQSINSMSFNRVHNYKSSDTHYTSQTLTNTWQNFSNDKHSNYLISPQTKLPVLANGSMDIPSNANNFHGQVNTSVNPRTGSASFGMLVASTLV